jgi:hypothetical protein
MRKALFYLVLYLIPSSALAQSATPISALPAASTLTGSEIVPVVQGGATKRATTGAVSATILGSANTWTAAQTFPAPTTANASINLPQGTAPTSPNNGDHWTTTAGAFAQINGTTIGPFISSSSPSVTAAGANPGTATTTVNALAGRIIQPSDYGAFGNDGLDESGNMALFLAATCANGVTGIVPARTYKVHDITIPCAAHFLGVPGAGSTTSPGTTFDISSATSYGVQFSPVGWPYITANNWLQRPVIKGINFYSSVATAGVTSLRVYGSNAADIDTLTFSGNITNGIEIYGGYAPFVHNVTDLYFPNYPANGLQGYLVWVHGDMTGQRREGGTCQFGDCSTRVDIARLQNIDHSGNSAVGVIKISGTVATTQMDHVSVENGSSAFLTQCAAPPAAWIPTHAYAQGTFASIGGAEYVVTTAGTSGSTGPSGAGDGITDGTVVWSWVGPTAGQMCPQFINGNDLEAEGFSNIGFDLQDVSEFYCVHCYYSNNGAGGANGVSWRGVNYSGTWPFDFKWVDGFAGQTNYSGFSLGGNDTQITGSVIYDANVSNHGSGGIEYVSGGQHKASGNTFCTLGGVAPSVMAGILVDAGVTGVTQTNNIFNGCSTDLANSAGINTSGGIGSYSGFSTVTASTNTLTAANAGRFTLIGVSGASTTVLPLGATVALGSLIHLVNFSTAVATITTQGSDFIYLGGSHITTTAMQVGDTLDLFSRGSGEWDLAGGTAILSAAAVSCAAGTPTSSFTVVSGRVTHC